MSAGVLHFPNGVPHKPAVSLNFPTGVLHKPTGALNFSAGPLEKSTGAPDKPAGVLNFPTRVLNKPTGALNFPAGVLNNPAGTPTFTSAKNLFLRCLCFLLFRRLLPSVGNLLKFTAFLLVPRRHFQQPPSIVQPK